MPKTQYPQAVLDARDALKAAGYDVKLNSARGYEFYVYVHGLPCGLRFGVRVGQSHHYDLRGETLQNSDGFGRKDWANTGTLTLQGVLDLAAKVRDLLK